MCRSLWQTPAALTLIRTCVPAGGGVGTSTSFRGALKSVTWKLFIVSLPLARRFRQHFSCRKMLSRPLLSVRHCHAFPCAVETRPGWNCPTGYGGHAVSARFSLAGSAGAASRFRHHKPDHGKACGRNRREPGKCEAASEMIGGIAGEHGAERRADSNRGADDAL